MDFVSLSGLSQDKFAAEKAAMQKRVRAFNACALYASGPFSRVSFLHTARRGLRTFTLRNRREDEKGALLAVISSTFAGGPSFNDRYVDTSSLCTVQA